MEHAYKEILDLRARLKEWASYVNTYTGPRYGNILAELIKWKGQPPKASGPNVEPYNARAEEVEAAVLAMPTIFRDVICQYYLTADNSFVCAKKLGMKRGKFWIELGKAEIWLLGRLSVETAQCPAT